MGLPDLLLVVLPALGLAVAVGLVRRRRTYLGLAVGVGCIAAAAVAAVLGYVRPIVGLLAWAMLLAAFVADEKQRRGLAISCFAVAFMALIVAAMYT